MGLLFSRTSFTSVLLGLFLSLAFPGICFVVAKMAAVKSELQHYETLVAIMLPRGLAAEVLASIPITSGMLGSRVFPEIAFIDILTTIIVCTVGVVVVMKRRSSYTSTYGFSDSQFY